MEFQPGKKQMFGNETNSHFTETRKRLIDNSKATSHSDPLFLKYKILKINDLGDFN